MHLHLLASKISTKKKQKSPLALKDAEDFLRAVSLMHIPIDFTGK